jgi:hypothetical protein
MSNRIRIFEPGWVWDDRLAITLERNDGINQTSTKCTGVNETIEKALFP